MLRIGVVRSRPCLQLLVVQRLDGEFAVLCPSTTMIKNTSIYDNSFHLGYSLIDKMTLHRLRTDLLLLVLAGTAYYVGFTACRSHSSQSLGIRKLLSDPLP